MPVRAARRPDAFGVPRVLEDERQPCERRVAGRRGVRDGGVDERQDGAELGVACEDGAPRLLDGGKGTGGGDQWSCFFLGLLGFFAFLLAFLLGGATSGKPKVRVGASCFLRFSTSRWSVATAASRAS